MLSFSFYTCLVLFIIICMFLVLAVALNLMSNTMDKRFRDDRDVAAKVGAAAPVAPPGAGAGALSMPEPEPAPLEPAAPAEVPAEPAGPAAPAPAPAPAPADQK